MEGCLSDCSSILDIPAMLGESGMMMMMMTKMMMMLMMIMIMNDDDGDDDDDNSHLSFGCPVDTIAGEGGAQVPL